MKKVDRFFIEEHEMEKNKKESRQERKRLSMKDRSKYKKSDVEKQKPLQTPKGFEARVLQINPEDVICQYQDKLISCFLKGGLKKEKVLTKNVLAVGDEVIIDQMDQNASIIHILPRKSILARADNLSRKKQQIIASNIDQVLITCSILEPYFKLPLIDRYIIAAYKGHIDPVIVVTKMDLLLEASDNDRHLSQYVLDELKKIADYLKIPVFYVSTKTNQGIDELKAYCSNKTSVLSGQSGVGKSSIINLLTELSQETKPIVSRTQKGSHTTTQAIMVPLLDHTGYIVDTPGIRSFGLWEIQKDDIKKYFTEIHEAAALCKYADCHHFTEPDCNVKILLEKGQINPLRFDSYCTLIQQAETAHLKR